jgi:hypothetical protein
LYCPYWHWRKLAAPEFNVNFISNVTWENNIRESQVRGGRYILEQGGISQMMVDALP